MTRNGQSSKNWRGDNRRRAILLEIDGRRGTALSGDGRFVRVKCPAGAIEGEEIVLTNGFAAWRAALPSRPRLKPGFAMALAVALCLVLVSPFATMRVLAGGSPVGYVSVDINPSVELGVNQWDRIVEARGLNLDGQAVLDGIRWKGRPLDDVVLDLTMEACDQGYLGDDEDRIVISSCPASDDGKVSEGLLRQVERVRAEIEARVAAKLGAEAAPVSVDTIFADAARVRIEAETLGLSVGRYGVLLAAEEAGLDVSPEDFQGGIGKAILTAGGHPGEIMKSAKTYRHMSKLAEKFEKRNGLESEDEEDDDGTEPDGEDAAGAGTGTEGGPFKGGPGKGGPKDDGGQPGPGDGSPDGQHGDPSGKAGAGSGQGDASDDEDEDQDEGDD